MITLAMIAALAMPPKQYDHPPRHPVTITEMAPEFIEAVCAQSPFDRRMTLACFIGGRGIFIRTDLTAKARAKVLRHEYGHVNGWVHGERPANAPGIKPTPTPTP